MFRMQTAIASHRQKTTIIARARPSFKNILIQKQADWEMPVAVGVVHRDGP
jgi:hypothetical protein